MRTLDNPNADTTLGTPTSDTIQINPWFVDSWLLEFVNLKTAPCLSKTSSSYPACLRVAILPHQGSR